MEKIKSRSNEKLKMVRAVRDGRDRSHLFAEGEKLAHELASTGLRVAAVFASASFADGPANSTTIELIRRKGVDICIVSDTIFPSIAETTTPQGIVVIAERPTASFEQIAARLREGASVLPIIVLLDRVNDPTNLGAIVRTAEAAGAAAVVTTAGSAHAFSPKAIRGSMGSAFRLPIVEGVSVAQLVNVASDHGLRISSTGAGVGIPHTEVDWTVPRVLALGSESHGVSEELLAASREHISIDIEAPVESLNLAVSCGIMLFQARSSVKLDRT